ncbi:MAG: hypothetical protein ACXWEV_09545 [Methylobacter sp.]
MIDIYNWSIKKAVFRHGKLYEPYLIGYVPSIPSLEIVRIRRFYVEERLIQCKDTGSRYILRGQSGLPYDAEAIWSNFKQFTRVIHDIDISHKY